MISSDDSNSLSLDELQKSLLRNTAYKSGFPSSVKKFFIHIPILSNCKVTCEIMFFYMISLLCTAVPCAHVINTEGSVTSDVIPYTLATSTDVSTLIPTETENRSLSGRALLPTGKNKFFINQLNIPVHDEPALSKEASNLLENPNPIISIKDGYLRGFIMETISSRPFAAFQGIPFAQPPVNQLRFQPPQKNFPWTGIKDVIEPSPQCIQADYIKQYQVHGVPLGKFFTLLNIAIYSIEQIPKYSQKERLPVMVFIHGGGFFFGSSSIYGPAYLLDQDVVLVSVNYRLGALGVSKKCFNRVTMSSLTLTSTGQQHKNITFNLTMADCIPFPYFTRPAALKPTHTYNGFRMSNVVCHAYIKTSIHSTIDYTKILAHRGNAVRVDQM
ncbi:Esterase E4 [Orchesella cincta]|uniref:Esterase E4 n=1 Tax=Orchesella cincta TaxID=48709 RepID=A0A1D2MUM4_ORCCI|nr:Esterase E4 [Orchesella cincta]